MNEDIKSKWLDALRSGTYEQGMELLAYDEVGSKTRYCCLGVLCDLAVKDGILPEPLIKDPGYTGRRPYVFGDYEQTALPHAVVRWAGLHDRSPSVETEQGKPDLADLNDDGKSFAEIADLIEEQL